MLETLLAFVLCLNKSLLVLQCSCKLLKKHKNSLEKENCTNRVLEIMEDILLSLKETQDKIKYRENYIISYPYSKLYLIINALLIII